MSLEDSLLDRDALVQMLKLMNIQWGDEEDAVDLIDLLLVKFSPISAWAWLLFRCNDLDGTPLDLIEQGKSRAVFMYARQMVEAEQTA